MRAPLSSQRDISSVFFQRSTPRARSYTQIRLERENVKIDSDW